MVSRTAKAMPLESDSLLKISDALSAEAEFHLRIHVIKPAVGTCGTPGWNRPRIWIVALANFNHSGLGVFDGVPSQFDGVPHRLK